MSDQNTSPFSIQGTEEPAEELPPEQKLSDIGPVPIEPAEAPDYEPRVSAAHIPDGFWRSIDYLLQRPEEVLESLRRDCDLWKLSRLFFLVTLVMTVIYGSVMGATNLLQGAETIPLAGKLVQVLIGAVKAPILFLLTFIIVLPPVYVSNTFMGAKLSFRLIQSQMLAAMAITSVVLASMSSVAFFFALTSQTYDFIKLLHVLFFGYAGTVGLVYLVRCVRSISSDSGRKTPLALFGAWLTLYGFVGTQLAWVMRPFVGSPGEPFQVFRPRSGNFYESVLHSLSQLLGG